MSEKSIGIALLGCGIVGGGVVQLLREQAELLKARIGISFDLRHVVVKGPEDYPPNAAELPMSTDANAAIDDPHSQVIIELIGGTGIAGQFIERALRLGKPVVTANKSLLAVRGPELFALARQHNTCIAFEASCGGGIPIIDALLRGLLANRVDALLGIVNGTCNFILSKMTQNNWSYDQALMEAQKQGFAEANPTLDVSGRDAAQKLAILASLAFNVRIAEADIHVEGIDKLDAADILYAKELGYVIKLLAIAERHSPPFSSPATPPKPPSPGTPGEGRGEGSGNWQLTTGNSSHSISLRVHPTLVHRDELLADVSGSFNAISIYAHALGHALWYGRGAGRTPTASAVVADLISIAMGTAPLAFKQLRTLPDMTPPASVLPFDQLQSRYYLRLAVRDQPGVLAQITRILGDRGISVSAIRQHESDDIEFVPIVITTHRAVEGSMQSAVAALNALPTVNAPAMCLRIIDQPKEFART